MALTDPHHDGSGCYVPEQAPDPGDTVPVFVRAPAESQVDGLWARALHDAEPVWIEGKVDRTGPDGSWWRCDLELRNPLTSYRFLLSGPGGGYRWLTGTGVHPLDVPDAADFRISTAPPPPDWALDAVVYQVFPDRFARSAGAAGRPVPSWARPAGWDDEVVFRGDGVSHQLYGGDLDGIAEHLDHLAAVGANTIYLTPFFPAESNHRYNAASFAEVDPLLGGDAALARLADAVHARGWRLVGDLTTNHCGDTHDWFRRALADPAAPEREFFYFDPPESNGYHGWLGVLTLPKLRHLSAELRRRLVDGPGSVAARWLRGRSGLDGWRVDVANMTGRHAEDDVNHLVARQLRATATAERADALVIAEHCHDASRDLAGDGWHGAMNYAGFLRPVWSWLRHPALSLPFLGLPVDVPALGAEALRTTVTGFAAMAPWRSTAASWSLLGSHDTGRIRTVVGDADRGEVAAGLLFTLLGVPMVFVGDEIGAAGVTGEDARRPFPWHRPETWDRRTLAYYRALAELRRDHPALRRGGLRWVHAAGDALAYLRETGEQRLLVLAARAPHGGLRLPAAQLGLTGEAPSLHGGGPPLRPDADGVVSLPGDGPAFCVWQLA
ncbi:MAG TPA: glycoside hydrolase family 13 protein [Actinoplanes sp.]|nr:glycoside hydrolase family 13 protein [Actinoplanes sp.]